MKKLIQKFSNWMIDINGAPYELLVIAIGLIIIIFFVQIGIHNGRKMERSEARNRAPWAAVDR